MMTDIKKLTAQEKDDLLGKVLSQRAKKAAKQTTLRNQKKEAGLKQLSDWVPEAQVENLRALIAFLEKHSWPVWAFCAPRLVKDKSRYEWYLAGNFGELPLLPNVSSGAATGAVAGDGSGGAQSSRQGSKEEA
jgi:hypothetical protein